MTSAIIQDESLRDVSALERAMRRKGPERAEIAIRFVVLLVMASILYVELGSLGGEPWLVPVWCAVYFFLAGLFQALLHAVLLPKSRLRYPLIVLNYGLILCAFAVAPLYLASVGDPTLDFVAFAVIAGHALLDLSRRHPTMIFAIIDTSYHLTVFGAVTAMIAARTDTPTGAALQVGGALALMGYYAFMQYCNVTTAWRLAALEKRAVTAERQQVVTQLTRGVAHEFNNILASLRGSLDLQSLPVDPEEKRQALEQAQEAVDRAARLTAQLQAFARRARLEPAEFAAGAFLRDLVSELETQLPPRLRLKTQLPDREITLYADPANLSVVLSELLANSVQAQEGPCRATLRLRPASDAPGMAEIVVEDDGPGIPDDLIDRVTEPFFTTQPLGRASGLGLSMAKGFAEQSGGGLSIITGGNGTQVILTLPTAARPSPTAGESAAPPTAADPQRA